MLHVHIYIVSETEKKSPLPTMLTSFIMYASFADITLSVHMLTVHFMYIVYFLSFYSVSYSWLVYAKVTLTKVRASPECLGFSPEYVSHVSVGQQPRKLKGGTVFILRLEKLTRLRRNSAVSAYSDLLEIVDQKNGQWKFCKI